MARDTRQAQPTAGLTGRDARDAGEPPRGWPTMLVTLVYHLVDGTLDTVNAVSEERFAKQIAHLAGCCEILALDATIDVAHGRRPMPARGVCLTFDDGYRNVVTTALPILAAAGASATLFPI